MLYARQPQRIISGLKETFIKRYIVEWNNKAQIRLEEQSEKRRVVGRIYGMKYSWKGHTDTNKHKNKQKKRSGQARLIYVKSINSNIPIMWRWAYGDLQSWSWAECQWIYILCATFISFRVLEARLVRIPELVCFRTCSCRALAAIYSTNTHACVVHPNDATENDADTT